MNPPVISVNIYDPLNRGDFQFYQRVIPNTSGHTISAFGGYDAAPITLAATKTQAEDWLENGLLRDVKIYASAQDVCWNGFVNEVRTNLSPYTPSLGPLLGIGNRVTAAYAPLVEGAGGDVVGGQSWTGDADDADSQTRYGVIHKVVNVGTATQANAENSRDIYLADNAWPRLSGNWTSQGNRPVTVTLNCLGYQHLLNYPVYVPSFGTVTADTKITDAIAENPNVSWLAYNTDNVEANTPELPDNEAEYRTAMTIIKEAVSVGDGANRWLFYILNDLDAYYHQAPTDVEYRAYVRQGGVVLESATQATIQPWRLKPGFWLAFYDFLVGRTVSGITEDPRMMFVEKVTYRAPFGLQLQGGRTDEIIQVLAMAGLGTTA